jgi:hypothetical protein
MLNITERMVSAALASKGLVRGHPESVATPGVQYIMLVTDNKIPTNVESMATR